LASGGRGNERQIAFPIAKDKEGYENEKNRRTGGMSTEAIAAIDALKPYGGADDVLYQISELNNADKHRILLTAGAAFEMDVGADMKQLMVEKNPALAEIKFPEVYISEADPQCPLKVGDAMFIAGLGAKPNPELKFRFVVSLNEPVSGCISLPKLLQGMISRVEEVVVALDKFTN
jgi:hypothetical protein